MAFAAPLLTQLMLSSGERLTLEAWLVLLVVLGAHLIVLKAVERRDWTWLGLGRDSARAPLLVRGAALGAVAIGLPAGLLLAARWLRVEPSADGSWGGAAYALATTLAPAALWEELAFRGYPFAVLRERFGAGIAVGVTSLVFGLLHVQNPDAAPLPIAMVIVAGFFLGGVLLATGSLWAAWAAHFAWNWTMAAIFHMSVSGGRFPTPDYRVIEIGPDWLTGGGWGPEGGLGALAGMTAAMWYLWARARRRDAAGAAPSTASGATTDTMTRPSGREER